MLGKEEKIIYSRNIKFNDKNENPGDLYTIIDSTSSLKFISIDKALSSNFKHLIKDIYERLEKILEKDYENLLSKGLREIHNYERYNFYLGIINYFTERLGILKGNLNTILKDARNIKTNLKTCKEKLENFPNLNDLNKNLKSLNEAEKKLKDVGVKEKKKIDTNIEHYIKIKNNVFNPIVAAEKKLFSIQKEIFQKSAEGLPSFLEHLKEQQIISKEICDEYKRHFLSEEKTIKDIFIKNGKKISPPNIDWASFFTDVIKYYDTFEQIETSIDSLGNEIININSFKKLIRLHFNFNQLFFNNKNLNLKNIVKDDSDSDKIELLHFLNKNRSKLISKTFTKELIQEITEIFESLEEICVKDKDYYNADLLMIISFTYFYKDKTNNSQGENKKYIGNIMKKYESFFDKKFLIELAKYKIGQLPDINPEFKIITQLYSLSYTYKSFKIDDGVNKEIVNGIVKEFEKVAKITEEALIGVFEGAGVK